MLHRPCRQRCWDHWEAKWPPLDDWISTVTAFARDLIQPTLVAVLSYGVALYLQGQERLHSLAQEEGGGTTTSLPPYLLNLLVALFPFVNATMIFALPMQHRFQTNLVEPVFAVMNQIEDVLKTSLQQLGPFVDQIIDGIQADFHIMLQPIQSTLDQIQDQAHSLEKASGNKDIDIPDPFDIDREMDQAQGMVTNKIREAEQYLEYEDYVPNYLDSQQQFHKRIVVPLFVGGMGFANGGSNLFWKFIKYHSSSSSPSSSLFSICSPQQHNRGLASLNGTQINAFIALT